MTSKVKQIKCPVKMPKRYSTVAQLQLGGNLTHLMHCSSCGSTYPVGEAHPQTPQGPFVIKTIRR